MVVFAERTDVPGGGHQSPVTVKDVAAAVAAVGRSSTRGTRRDATRRDGAISVFINANERDDRGEPVPPDHQQDARRVRKYRRAAYADLSCPSARPSDAPVFLCSSELESSRDELLVYQTNVVSMVVRTGRQKRNDSAPIQSARCRFHGLAISNAKY